MSETRAYLSALALGCIARVLRRASTRPAPVGASGVVRTTNVFVDLYAARLADGAVVLFDTGIDRRGRAIDRLLAALGATRRDVRHVFLTHAHPDHTAGAHLFAQAAARGEVALHGGARDADLFAGRAQCRRRAVAAFRRALPAPSVELTAPIAGDAPVRIALGGGEHVLAVPLPGDTPGACAYLFRGVLILGDGAVRRDARLVCSPDWTLEDAAANHRALVALPGVLAGEAIDVVCAAHGGPTAPGEGRVALEGLACRARRELARLPAAAVEPQRLPAVEAQPPRPGDGSEPHPDRRDDLRDRVREVA